MRAIILASILAMGVALPATAHSAPGRVEVLVLERRVRDAVVVEGGLRSPVTQGPDQVRALGDSLSVNGRPWPQRTLVLGDDPAGTVALRAGDAHRRYPGRVRVRAEAGRLQLVNDAPIERYVAGVVGAEMPSGWPLSAKMAQAVLARTLAHRGGAHPGGRLCDLTHCQAYAGLATGEAMRAAEATQGRILTEGGAPIQALYHSTCGGLGADSRAVFGGPLVPYLLGRRDAFCSASPHSAPWRVRLPARRLAEALGLTAVERVELRDRAPGGWVASLAVDGRPMSGYRFWQALGRHLGWGMLKSLNFDVARDGGDFVFTGKGLGHGVGLCQWGARGRALAGWDWQRILADFYPGARVARTAS